MPLVAAVATGALPAPVRAALTAGGASAEVMHAFEGRAVALARGLDDLARPADVLAVAGARRPFAAFGLPDARAQRFRSLMARALEGAPPRIQTNMNAGEVRRLLELGGRFRTVHDAVGDPAADAIFKGGAVSSSLGRASDELERGYFGTGTTIYGTVQFTDVTHAALTDPARVGAKLVSRSRALATGNPQYGTASVVLGERALGRATFIPADTGVVAADVPLGSREQLADVVAEAMLRHFGVGETGMISSVPFGRRVMSDDRLRRSFERILDQPDDRAIEAIRHHLRSRAFTDEYVEAQVRHANVDDIVAINVQRPDIRDFPVPADLAATRRTQDELAPFAAARDIPVRYSDDPLPKVDYGR